MIKAATQFSQIFTSQHVVPSVYEKVLDEALGSDWINWELITIIDSIEQVFGVVPSQQIKDKLAAYKLFKTTDAFYHDARTFESIVLAINDRMVRPEVFELVAPEDILYAVLVLRADPKMFEREIYAYVKACMEHAGVLKYPKLLRFAQPEYPKELAVLVEQINPISATTPTDERDLVQVQSAKLRDIIDMTTAKLAASNLSDLVASLE